MDLNDAGVRGEEATTEGEDNSRSTQGAAVGGTLPGRWNEDVSLKSMTKWARLCESKVGDGVSPSTTTSAAALLSLANRAGSVSIGDKNSSLLVIAAAAAVDAVIGVW